MKFPKDRRVPAVLAIGSLFPIFALAVPSANAQEVPLGLDAAPAAGGSLTTPTLNEAGTPGGLIVPGQDYTVPLPPPSPDVPDSLTDDGISDRWTSEGEGWGNFFFPGGYGFLPELVNTGAGLQGRPPFDLNFTLQQGYTDNLYSASDDSTVPVKGSFMTDATLGLNVLLAKTRDFLTLGLNAGGRYYWNKESAPLAPTGQISLTYGHKLSPRAQFSARVNGGYFSQPDLSAVNAPTRPNSGDYFNLNNHFDFSYQLTPRYGTVTSAEVNTQLYRESQSQDSNYIELTLGEALRAKLTPRMTGVLDLRGSIIRYKGGARDSNTQYLLTGLDFRLTPRLNGTFRAGVNFRQFNEADSEDRVGPYFESSLGYLYGKGSQVRWTNRFGFEESNDPFQSNQTLRTGLWADHVISAKLAANFGISYAYQMLDNLTSSVGDGHRDIFTANVGLRYRVNRSFTVFSNYSFSLVNDVTSAGDYRVNQVFVGTTFHF